MPDISPPPQEREENDAGSPCGSGVVLFIDPDSLDLLAIPTYCHRWDCPTCGPMRVRQAQAKGRAGRPERIITLTSRPVPGLSIDQAIRWFRERWRRLLTELRKTWPHMQYMAFTELHKSGWPHMHILTRGAYIPQRMLSAIWLRLTGSFKVHIQAITRSWKGIHEATKYVLKTARDLHAAASSLPVFTCSRDWVINKADPEKRPPGPFAFYAFCALGFKDFRGLVDLLGGALSPMPSTPRCWRVDFARPPDETLCDHIALDGVFGQSQAVTAIQAYLTQPESAQEALEQLQELTNIARFGSATDVSNVTYADTLDYPADVSNTSRPPMIAAGAPLF